MNKPAAQYEQRPWLARYLICLLAEAGLPAKTVTAVSPRRSSPPQGPFVRVAFLRAPASTSAWLSGVDDARRFLFHVTIASERAQTDTKCIFRRRAGTTLCEVNGNRILADADSVADRSVWGIQLPGHHPIPPIRLHPSGDIFTRNIHQAF